MSGFAKGTDGKTRTLKNPLEGATGDIGLDNATFNTLDVSGNTAVGNIFTDGYYYANGAAVEFGGGGSYSNASVTTLLADFGSNSISTTGNVTAGYFVGDGSQLTGLATVAFTGSYLDLVDQPTIPTGAANITYAPTTANNWSWANATPNDTAEGLDDLAQIVEKILSGTAVFNIAGPYSNDANAGAGGVPIGGIYYNASGGLVVRRT